MNGLGRWRQDGWILATCGLALVISAPVLAVLSFLSVPADDVWRHLADTVLARYLSNSLWLMLGVAAGTAFGGVLSAWIVTMCRFPGRAVFEWALLLPMAMPAYVIAYTYTGLLDFAGPAQSLLREIFGWRRGDYWFFEVRSLPGAAVMLTLVLYPYVYLLARAAFLEQSVCVLEAARTLGRGPWRAFFTVAMPLARPSIVAGLALALMETLNDFGTVQYFAVDTFTTGIFRTWFGLGDPAAAAQLGGVLMLFVFALLAAERFSRGQARFHHTTGRYRRLPRLPLTPLGAAAAWGFCALPVFFGFILPAIFLAYWAILTANETFDARFFVFAANSVILSAITAGLAVALAVLLAYGAKRGRAAMAAVRIAGMGYAVPGAVIAVGLLLVTTWLDAKLSPWLGVILTGSAAALIAAYVVRFLAVSLGTVEAALGKVTPSMDAAARVLGEPPLGVIRRVHAPIVRGSLLTAGLLVFVDVMKELPATLILRPFNFDTLAVRTYQLAADERLHHAAGPGLAIVLVGILPVIALSRAIARSRPGQGGE